jgi:hypothetical protein
VTTGEACTTRTRAGDRGASWDVAAAVMAFMKDECKKYLGDFNFHQQQYCQGPSGLNSPGWANPVKMMVMMKVVYKTLGNLEDVGNPPYMAKI